MLFNFENRSTDLVLYYIPIDRFATVAPTGLSGDTSNKRKAPTNAWFEQFEIIDNLVESDVPSRESKSSDSSESDDSE